MTKVASEILKGKNPFDAVDSAGIRVQGLRMPVEKIENIYETEKQALPEFETKKFTDIP
jgi:BioD-like phosphotransacetylase family protein